MSEDEAEAEDSVRPSRLVAVLLAFFASPVLGFLYLGRLRRGLGWLAAGQTLLLLLFLAVDVQFSPLVWLVMALGPVMWIPILVDLLRVQPTSHRPSGARMFLLAILVGLLSYGERLAVLDFVIQASRIPSGSMIPSLQVNDHFYVNMLRRVPLRGEVILFIYPMDTTKDFVKRVMGIPGDKVEVCGRHVSINGQQLREEPLSAPCEYDDFDDEAPSGPWHKVGCTAVREWNQNESYVTVYNTSPPAEEPDCNAWTVPPAQVFVMGDNRDNSHDSRYWGFVPYRNIKGMAWFVWWSKGATIRWDRIGQLIHQRPTPPPPSQP